MKPTLVKRVSYDQGCFRSVQKLPGHVSGSFLAVMSRYMDNPSGNWLNLEFVEGSKNKSFRSLGLDQSYRAIAFETETDIVFLHVNVHDQAYRWAGGRSIKLDSASNRIRIVEEIEQDQKASGIEDVDKTGDIAFEELLITEESRQTIFTPESIEELRRFFDGELEGWCVWLHPMQRKLAYKEHNGPAMVRGGAGTGKTVVAMHRAKYIADQLATDELRQGQKVLVTTFTTTLAKHIESNLKTLCPRHMSGSSPRIEVISLDRWARQYLKKKQFNRQVVTSEEDQDKIANLWLDVFDTYTFPEGLSEAFVKAEWEQIVQAKGLDDLTSYLKASRSGRGTPLNRAKRKELWNIFAFYRAKLLQSGLLERDDVYREAIPLLMSEHGKNGYASVIVDEAQDMGEQAFKLIRALIPESLAGDKNSIFIVGDENKRTYNRCPSIPACGINIVGRSRKLRLNYRTTYEVRACTLTATQ